MIIAIMISIATAAITPTTIPATAPAESPTYANANFPEYLFPVTSNVNFYSFPCCVTCASIYPLVENYFSMYAKKYPS